MAQVTLCSDGIDISDQVFTVAMTDPDAIEQFVKLVQHGGTAAGLIKPAVNVESGGRVQTVSARNGWRLDRSMI